ncbi:hypothetical protein [Demequina globuliformis]|uniref:hypothetical protein n=1 Tax=Demequina globuliformis TaxID=676202 RepID=UPI0007810187|nr:hypothetical protein [Demequina globuliformis]
MLPVALAVSVLAAGCTGSTPAPGETEAAQATEQSSPPAEAAAAMPVGPLEMDAAEYWTPTEADGDIAVVTAGGCQDDGPCPAFAVISGETAAAANPSEAFFDDGVACPVPGTQPSSAELLSEHEATVAGHSGTMHMFEITCADDDGAEQVAVPQNQWSLETDDGTLLVVDRWSFDGLLTKVADATLVAS